MRDRLNENCLIDDYRFTDGFLSIMCIDLIAANLLGIINRMKFFKNVGGTAGLFKITIIGQVIWFVYWLLLKKRRLELSRPTSILFLVYLVISTFVGIAFGNINKKVLSHIFEYAVPVLMIGMSRVIYENIKGNMQLKDKLDRIMVLNAYMYIACTLIFRVMYAMGLMYWNAYTSSACLIIMPYLFFATNKTMLAFALCAAGALSGGRSVLVRTLAIVFFYYFTSKRKFSKKIKETVIMICGLIIAVYLLNNTHLFDRILLTINNLMGEEKNLNLATGGRTNEIDRVILLMNKNPISWIVGYGFGVYQKTDSGSIRSFAHFMPLTYTMISGLIFTAVLYFGFLANSIRLLIDKTTIGKMFFCYLFITVFIGSLFDAAIINDYKYWLIVGLSYCHLRPEKCSLRL